MAKADSVSSGSEASSIFGSEQDGRCIVLREKRQHISTLYAKWAALHAKYAHYLPQEIENNEGIYNDVSDIDSDRNQPVWPSMISWAMQERYLTRQMLVTSTSCIMLLKTARGNDSKWRNDPFCWGNWMSWWQQVAVCQRSGRFVLTWGALTGLIWTLNPFPVRQGRQRCASF